MLPFRAYFLVGLYCDSLADFFIANLPSYYPYNFVINVIASFFGEFSIIGAVQEACVFKKPSSCTSSCSPSMIVHEKGYKPVKPVPSGVKK